MARLYSPKMYLRSLIWRWDNSLIGKPTNMISYIKKSDFKFNNNEQVQIEPKSLGQQQISFEIKLVKCFNAFYSGEK